MLEITYKEVRKKAVRLSEEKKKVSAAGAEDKEAGNCTKGPVPQERVVERSVRVSGVKLMGVFTLCGVLATLGWGGVTSVLVPTTRAWPVRELTFSKDASTSMSTLRLGGRNSCSNMYKCI